MPTGFAAAGASAAIALAAAWAERRRGRRADPDRVGWVDWRAVQAAALVSTILAASLALHAG